MKLFQKMDREKWLKGIKLTAAAILAITAAGLLGLKFSATAGIITILSIQNTKKETLQVACRRGLAFLCALGLAAAAFGLLGFTIPAFALYLLGFSCVCLYFGWTEAIAMDSVLITHFLTEQNMGPALLLNEIGLFLLGTGMGIGANLHLRKKERLYDRLAQAADQRMRDALKLLYRQLLADFYEQDGEAGNCRAVPCKGKNQGGSCQTASGDAAYACSSRERRQKLEQETKNGLDELDKALEKLQDCAYRNWNNTFFQASVFELEYAGMRSRQAEVLRHIYASVKMTESVPRQAHLVAALIERIEAEYDRDNTVETLQEALQKLYEQMRREALPLTREEFEARAVLFYLLKQLEEFLQLKRDFAAKTVERGQKN